MEFIIFLLVVVAYPKAALLFGLIYFCWVFKIQKPTSFIIKILGFIFVLSIISPFLNSSPSTGQGFSLTNVQVAIIFIVLILFYLVYFFFYKYEKQTQDFFTVQEKFTRLKLILSISSNRVEIIKTISEYKANAKNELDSRTIKIILNNSLGDDLWADLTKSICLLDIKEIFNEHYDELVNSYSNLDIKSLQHKINELCSKQLKLLLSSDFDYIYKNIGYLTHDEKIDAVRTFDRFKASDVPSKLLEKAFFDRYQIANPLS